VFQFQQQGQDIFLFYKNIQTCPRSHPASYTMGTRASFQWYSGRSMQSTTQPHQVLWLRITAAIPPLPLYTFMVQIGITLPSRNATNQQVAGLILDGVIGIFQRHNPSSRTMALGSTQPPTEMSTRCISWGKGGRCVRLTLQPSCATVMKFGNLNFLEPFGSPQACNKTALPPFFYLLEIMTLLHVNTSSRYCTHPTNSLMSLLTPQIIQEISYKFSGHLFSLMSVIYTLSP
jgi:hypothetical protein